MFDKQLYKLILFIGALALSIFSGVACDGGAQPQPPTATSAPTDAAETVTDIETIDMDHTSGGITYWGVASLEEVILNSDIIAIVVLNTLDRGVDVFTRGVVQGDTVQTRVFYSKTLEFTFDVEEYLKGTGEDQVVGLVFNSDLSQLSDTAAGAEMAKDLSPPTLYSRKAVVFLRDDAEPPEVNRGAGRYYLGGANEWEDSYSIDSPYYRAWLPAASAMADEERFLMGASSTPTITLDELRARISALNQAIAGRSDEYIDCLRYKAEREREVLHLKGTQGGDYFYYREDRDIESGMPRDTHIYTGPLAYLATDEVEPEERDRYVMAGRDPQYFRGAWPGEIFLKRPLPQGTYRVNHAYLPAVMIPCGASVPEDEMGRMELFVNVTAPDGTLHEAFFDPVTVGAAVAADSANGMLEPRIFTDANGVPAVIWRIAWEAGTVTLALLPYTGIADRTVDFIALDGSVALSLAVADAEVDTATGTLTWKVESQPWQSGDKLMLRISATAS